MARLMVLLFLVGCAPLDESEPMSAKSVVCTPTQCAEIKAKSGGFCGAANPYGCTDTGGCYSTEDAAKSGCPNNWCKADNCSRLPQPQRASRNVTFANNCTNSLDIWLTDPSPSKNPHRFCPDVDGGVVPNCKILMVPAKTSDGPSSATYEVSLVKGSSSGGDYYYLPAGGIVFWAMPDDKDTSNTTLWEVNFGASNGVLDVYDLSAIPPGNCAGHVRTGDNDYGYADHLPYKDPSNPDQNWDCLKKPDGGVDTKTCGDGLGYTLCPTVTVDSGVLTTSALTADKGTSLGCGVSGEKCCAFPPDGSVCAHTKETSCCPQICAAVDGEDPKSAAVRSKVYRCAHEQGLLTAKVTNPKENPRQTGYWKGMKVEPVWLPKQDKDPSCLIRSCVVPAGSDISQIGSTCQAYLWPYDDATALVNCNAIPDYKVTFCP